MTYYCHDHKKTVKFDKCTSDDCLVTPSNFSEIEHDVPFSDQLGKPGVYIRLLKRMKVGDSIVVERNQDSGNLGTSARKLGRRITQRKLPDGKIRVWVVK